MLCQILYQYTLYMLTHFLCMSLLSFHHSMGNEHEDLDPINLDDFENKRLLEQRVPKELLEPASETHRRRILCDAMGETVSLQCLLLPSFLPFSPYALPFLFQYTHRSLSDALMRRCGRTNAYARVVTTRSLMTLG